MREFAIPIPTTLEEQQAIVSEIESRLSVVDNLEKEIEANLQRADHLRQSILKRAFSGLLFQNHRSRQRNPAIRLSRAPHQETPLEPLLQSRCYPSGLPAP